ncbi:hypothetical protein [Pseudoalteromonas tunicata]|uniref:Putative orphan protein n=1 Tax=Pseudoalteromonas tunicata D2 TaxID=87626 RepID=A4C9P2_9GAMM|nr:hypothetical protein [Pseudoalteromonas tunicata]ATC94645.1 hypothetical protein PTUN_a2117 [Pseudoalteromonas tunicata]AXT30366.1 hypothetical protein D1819_05720 [Pseudoalteromonas tunicata]EAR28100.1 putative orphan protein [Pseudoalteromonas tunicata D2]MDP4982309.1 hypothetical protein [Pseudoalteromonas tunicata]
MKYVLALVAISIASYLYYQEMKIEQAKEQYSLLLQKLDSTKVNTLEIKNALSLKLQVSCNEAQEQLLNQGSTKEECLSYYQSFNQECLDKVFRLAPIELSSKSEFMDYAKRYQRCILPIDLANISATFL